MAIALIAWDFDGVLNANIRDGRFIWTDGFEAEWGVPVEGLTDYFFRSGRFQDVLVGARDFLDLLQAWIDADGHDFKAEEIMAYWFARDAHPDAEVLALSQRVQARQVIATNNEAHRAAYIWGEMGYSARMERIFAAGPMGVKKPDAGFFAEITDWAGCKPEAVLLVDDHLPNVEAAQALGWQAFHFTDESRPHLADRLEALGAI